MSEEQAQALMQQLQTLEGYLADIVQKEESVMRLLQEATGAIEAIRSLDGNLEQETLIPVGMGVYVKSKIEPNQKMMINIGAGASVEQERGDTINYIEARIKELEIALQQLTSQRREVSLRLEQGQQEMNKLIQLNRNPT